MSLNFPAKPFSSSQTGPPRRLTCYMMLFTLSDVKSPRGSGISGVSGCLGRSGHTRPARSRPLSLWAYWPGQKFPRAVAAHYAAVCTTTTSSSPENQLTSSFHEKFFDSFQFHKNIFFHVFIFQKKVIRKNAVKSTNFEWTHQ